MIGKFFLLGGGGVGGRVLGSFILGLEVLVFRSWGIFLGVSFF